MVVLSPSRALLRIQRQDAKGQELLWLEQTFRHSNPLSVLIREYMPWVQSGIWGAKQV